MAILSFHLAIRSSLAGEDEGWRNLIRFFLPITEHLVAEYFSDVWPKAVEAGAALFSRLRENTATRLRSFTGSAEKEFLMFLRDELFACGREQRSQASPLGMTHEQFAQLLNQFLPIPREAVVMLAKDYKPEKFSVVLHMEESTAKGIQESANQKLEALGISLRLPANLDRMLWQLEQEEATPDCVPVRTFVRILDGQITWREKEAADRHMAGCLHCFQHFVTYQELHWFYLEYPPADAKRVEAVAAKIGFTGREQGKKESVLAKVLRPFRSLKLVG